MAGVHSFPSSQKLKSRKVIGQLFESGKHAKAYPIRAVFGISAFNSEYHKAHVQMGISVSKRSFKSAVDRNRIKRQVREAYRMYHAQLLSAAEERNLHLAIMMIYIDRKEPDFEHLERKVKRMVGQLGDAIKEYKS